MPEGAKSKTGRDNHILAALPEDSYQRLAPHLRYVDLPHGLVLAQSGEFMEQVYFPSIGVISMVLDSAKGPTVEVGIVGREGMAGITSILGSNPTLARAMVQVPGHGWRISAATLRLEVQRGGVLQDIVYRYLHALLVQNAQIVLCNRVHSVEERLSRWLLMLRDRLHTNNLEITHEYISDMLGVRRAGVTLEIGRLRQAGLIEASRGMVTLLNTEALEDSACECYGIIRDEFKQFL